MEKRGSVSRVGVAPKGRAALAKRQKARADLQGQDIIWVGFAATEANIQRIGTLLMLADWPTVVEAKQKEDQLESVIPGGEHGFEAEPPEMEFDFEAIRRAIVKDLTHILGVDPDRKPRVMEVIKAHGGEKLSTVPNNNLPDLYKALAKLRKEYP